MRIPDAGLAVQDHHSRDDRGNERLDGSGSPRNLRHHGSEHPEVFPITVPAGVLLIGDEANKGAGGSPTTIFGGGSAPAFPGVIVALLPGTGSTIAGFTITNASGNFHDGLILSNSSVTVRNNTITVRAGTG